MNTQLIERKIFGTYSMSVVIKSIIIFLVICCILITPVRRLSFNSHLLKSVDEKSTQYLDKTLLRASIAYGLCRATNAAVSFLQEIDFGFEAIGTITLNPFEFLDPLNDLVERFSWILLAAMASIGIQKFLIQLLPGWTIYFILLPGLLMWLTGLWTNKHINVNLLGIGKQFVLLAVILRFIIPAEVAINNWIYDYHLENKYKQSINDIKTSVKDIEEKNPVKKISIEESQEAVQKEKGIFTSAKKKWSNIIKALVVAGNLDSKFKEFNDWLKNKLPILIKNFISLIILFILNTIFLPVFTLWLIVYLIRIITRAQLGHEIEKKFKEKIFQTRQLK